jgi:hypothetical protein
VSQRTETVAVSDNHLVRLLFASILVVAALSSACGASDTYSAEEVQVAFEAQGLVLHERVPPTGSVPTPWGSGRKLLVPRSGAPFYVYVASATDAEQLWSMLTAHVPEQGSDTFDARRANVVASSDGGLAVRDRERVEAALEALPDKGSSVDVVPASE